MPEGTSTNSGPVCPLPVTMPGPITPPLGDWHGRGLCIGEDPDIFFPAHGHPATKAREICAACLAHRDCLEYATEADEFGIWGGLDQHIKTADTRAVEDALCKAGKKQVNVTISYADHGFFCDARASFNVEAAALAWKLLLQFLEMYVKGAAEGAHA